MGIHLRTIQGVACHMESHNVTCHPTQANTPRLNPCRWRLVQCQWDSIYRPRRDGRLSWPRCLITRGRGIEPKTAGSDVRRPNHCAIKTPSSYHYKMQDVNVKTSINITKNTMQRIIDPTPVSYTGRNFGIFPLEVWTPSPRCKERTSPFTSSQSG